MLAILRKTPINLQATIMRWLFWTSDNDGDECKCNSKPISNSDEKQSKLFKDTKDWNALSNATNWSHFIEPSNLIPTILLTSGILFAVRIHRRYLRRIPEASNISPSYLRQRSILGKVTSVGDGDNFRIYHTPGGMLAGWGWLRKVPTSKKDLKNNTVRNTSIYRVISFVEISNLLTDSHPYCGR